MSHTNTIEFYFMEKVENPVENWKPVKGYESLYRISDLGNVYSLLYDRVMKPSLKKRGYYNIILFKNGQSKTFRLSRLVALKWIPNPNNHPTVNHLNHITGDNRAVNLEWCTHNENNTHRYIDKTKSSKYVGVQWHKATQKWLAKIKINQKAIHLGLFDNEYDAHLAYIDALGQNKMTNKYSSNIWQ